jgi:hypothetical protein
MSQPPMRSAPPTQPLPPLQPQPWPQQGMPPGGLQPPYAAVPVQQQPKKPKRFGWPTVIITALAALSLGGIIGNVGDTGTTAEPSATATASKPAEAKSGPSASKAPEAKKTTEPVAESTMGEGTYQIGVDAKPGRYKTQAPQDSANCYWERLKDDRGGFDSIIANNNVNPGARVSITVKQGEFFNSHGCGTWTMV